MCFWIAIDALLVLLIARGSPVALAVPLVLNVLGVLAILLFAIAPLPPGVVAFLFVKAAEIAVLVLLAWRRRGTGPQRTRGGSAPLGRISAPPFTVSWTPGFATGARRSPGRGAPRRNP